MLRWLVVQVAQLNSMDADMKQLYINLLADRIGNQLDKQEDKQNGNSN